MINQLFVIQASNDVSDQCSTTSVIINVTTVLIATAAPVESSSSDSSSTGYMYVNMHKRKYQCTSLCNS